MKSLLKLSLLAAFVVVLPAANAQSDKPTAAKMTAAASTFLNSLTPELKAKASFKFDDAHRTTWFFTPQQDKDKKPTRKGVRREELTRTQEEAAFALLKTGLSDAGFEQARTIMENEEILHKHEGDKGTNVRSPGWYFFSIFGEPGAKGTWGWRLEGHHLSVNFTLKDGEVVGASPVLFGTNPAEFKDGPDKGKRTLANVEDVALDLIKSLSFMQVKEAMQAKPFGEIKEKQATADVGEPVGISWDKLSDKQQAKLIKLVDAYATRLPADLATAEKKRAVDTMNDKVHFAYFKDESKPGVPMTYRVYGNSCVIEFIKVQADSMKNPANHIHSAWRRLPADFEVK
ncbi:DUF3500 domain-containing protein [soil metagenome]